VDIEETRQAYLRALDPQLQNDYEQLKTDYEALKKRHERVLVAVEHSVEAVLRIAREGKVDL
jgi:hypothetical protein